MAENSFDFKIFDSLFESILVVDQRGQFQYANPAAFEFLGLRAQSFKQTAFPGRIQLSPQLDWDEKFYLNLSSASPYTEVQFVNGKKSGTFQISAQPLCESNDGPLFLLTLYDKSLEYSLHQKYRSQLIQKEEFLQEINTQRADLLLINSKLDRKIEHISFLLEFSESTRFLLDEEMIVQHFLNQAIEKVGFMAGFYFKWDANKDIFSLEASTSTVSTNRIEFPQSYNESELLKLDGDPLTVYYREECEALKVFYKHFYKHEIHSVACMMLKASSQVLGFIHLVNFMQNPKIDSDTLEFLDFLSNPLSMTVKTAKLYQTSITDELTQLNNVRYFHSRLASHFSQATRESKTFAVLLCDVDHFKKVNDTYGHPMGDQVLQMVARTLKGQLRTSDLLARYGGEEMVAILFDTDEKGAVVAAEKLRAAVEKGFLIHSSGPLKVTISIGIAVYPQHGMTKDLLIEEADKALYRAKHLGRNNCQVAQALIVPEPLKKIS